MLRSKDRPRRSGRVRRPLWGLIILVALGLSLPPAAPAAWTITANNMQDQRQLHTATLLADGRVLVVGGWGDNYYNLELTDGTIDLFDPVTGLFTPGTPLPTLPTNQSRAAHSATLLQDGRVLVAGGENKAQAGASDILDSALLYDPGANSWSFTGNLPFILIYHTATRLASGQVLVTGGYGPQSPGFHPVGLLYDPGSGNWSNTKGSPSTGRTSHTATLLADGRVLVAGGQGPSSYPAQAELYTPSKSAPYITLLLLD